jgi:hypothetical protein
MNYRNERITQINYEGADFMVIGSWIEPEPDSLYEEGHPGYYDDYHIEFGQDEEGNDFNITEYLRPEAVEKIIEKAEEKEREKL